MGLLLDVFDDLKVPEAVYMETVAPEKPFSEILGKFLSDKVVKADTTRWILAAGGLGRGEIEAMALYKQIDADALLIDDRRARIIAEHNRVNCIGALGFLLLAKQKGKVGELKPYIKKLCQSSIHYSAELLDKVIQLARE
ncbi:MAG: DUF3368 domain-containing protein [Chloroflexi bacterium]|nr:DUF3368 domain-containing protein [Chloroflexota bacterium]